MKFREGKNGSILLSLLPSFIILSTATEILQPRRSHNSKLWSPTTSLSTMRNGMHEAIFLPRTTILAGNLCKNIIIYGVVAIACIFGHKCSPVCQYGNGNGRECECESSVKLFGTTLEPFNDLCIIAIWLEET